jgi:low affinity Fe/Cu permease
VANPEAPDERQAMVVRLLYCRVGAVIASAGIGIASRPWDAMAQRKIRGLAHGLERVSEAVTRWAGSSSAFALALGIVLVWALLGPVFQYSNTWQLVINTGTTIVTFLMVFLIQRSQNKEALAIHLKLNEIVAALEGASNRLIDAEDLPEKDLEKLERHYGELADLAANDRDLTQSHSIEEARHRHSAKRHRGRRRTTK